MWRKQNDFTYIQRNALGDIQLYSLFEFLDKILTSQFRIISVLLYSISKLMKVRKLQLNLFQKKGERNVIL